MARARRLADRHPARLILFLAYYGVVTPYGLARRLVGDPLARRWDRRSPTYFVRSTRP